MGILDRIFRGGSEYDVFGRTAKIVNHASAANKILVRIINGSDEIEEVHRIERASDKDAFEITNSITSGAIAPNLIDDMIQFVDKEDDIVDLIFNLSRTIVRFRKAKEGTDTFAKKSLLEMSELTESALRLLYEMHRAGTLAEARRLRAKIKAIEHKGDILKDKLLDYAYSTRLNFRSFYYIQDVAYLSDDILDRCEDASDMISGIMRSIIT